MSTRRRWSSLAGRKAWSSTRPRSEGKRSASSRTGVDISRRPVEPDAPVRVLHVLLLDALGGTERIVATPAEHLQTSSLSTDVAILATPGPIWARLRAQGIAVASLGDPLPVAAWRLARHLRTTH